MRDRLIMHAKSYLKGKKDLYAANVEAILEDPSGLTSPAHLLIQNLEEVQKYQGLLESLAGYEDE